MSKLSDLYIGAFDFFAILLPGAIATVIFAPYFTAQIKGTLIGQFDTEIARWATFLSTAYLVGHLVFLIGSRLDPLFHKWREIYLPRGEGCPYTCATLIRDSVLSKEERLAVNTYQWARSVLMEKFPKAAQDINRLEADSKFFRSLLVVCVIVLFGFLIKGDFLVSLILSVLSVGCVIKYGQRRLKSEKQAYTHIISLNSLGLLKESKEPPNQDRTPHH